MDNLSTLNFPRLIRYKNSNSKQGSPKRVQMRSQETKVNQSDNPVLHSEETFHITDLKQYERLQRSNYFDQTRSSPIPMKKTAEKSPELEIMQTKLTGRKLNQFSMFDLLPINIKEFYQSKKEIVQILDDYGIINEQMTYLIQQVKCYRFELGSSLERIVSIYYKVLERILESNIKIFDDSKVQFDKQLDESFKTIQSMESEMKKMEDKQRNIKNLLGYHESEYKICKLNCDALQNEVVMLHDLIKQDLQQMIVRIGQLEDSRRAPDVKSSGPLSNDPSENLAINLQNLKKEIDKLEQEHQEGTNVIGSMNVMLKAMLKGSKQDKYTQVDEGELYANTYFLVTSKNDLLIEAFPSEPEIMKSMSNHWSLSKSLMIFLKNVIKDNDVGRVIPWNAFKQTLYDIYSDRIKDGPFIQQSENNNILLDEYVILYMIKKYRNRRQAELKLLEFLVTLKYHIKAQMRAHLFAKFLGIIPITSQNDGSGLETSITYKLDSYLINYYLFCFDTINQIPNVGVLFDTEDGTTIVCSKAMELTNTLLPFAPEATKQKVRRKIDKGIPAQNNEQTVDIDVFYGWLLTEYLEIKRAMVRSLVKQFTRRVEGDRGGVCDYKDFDSIVTTDRSSTLPILSDIIKLRTFFTALTSGSNTNDVTSTQLLIACSNYGIDSPYAVKFKSGPREASSIMNEFSVDPSLLQTEYFKPTSGIGTTRIDQKTSGQSGVLNIRNPSKTNMKKISGPRQASRTSFGKDEVGSQQGKDNSSSGQQTASIKERVPNFQQEIQKFNTAQITLLTQHYAILKDLRQHCTRFMESVEQENNPKKLWQEFKDISNILDASLNFLNFPIQQK